MNDIRKLAKSVPGAPDGMRRLWPLYAGFAATGVGVALPGTILPVLLQRWKLQDEGGGNLFLLAFLGSSLGALLVSGRLLRAIAIGCLAIALGGLGMALLPARLALSCVFVFGLGLGSTMTAVSLLVQRRTQGSSRAMVRLNLLWALGASLCPVLAVTTLRTGKPGGVLYPVVLGFCLLAGWAVFELQHTLSAEEHVSSIPYTMGMLREYRTSKRLGSFFRAIPASLIVLVMLATGVEAAAGGWLSTYAKRGGDPFAGVIAAPTCLWVGLLLSRLFWSVLVKIRHERLVIQGSLMLMALSAAGLLAAGRGWLFFAAALGLGFGVGPVYPLLLAKVLRRHASGLIFFLAGLSSATLPWLMGYVSTQSGSLHTGFYVPATGALVMVLLSVLMPRDEAVG